MIKKSAKLSLLALCASLTVGCASQSDFDKLQAEVNTLKSRVAAVNTTADEAAAASVAALAAAESAQVTASAAQMAAADANSRIDRMFKRSMMK